MRWRFTDKVERFEPWESALGRKAVSLEEYVLYEPLGREGILPEALVMETCVELMRWLVARSSQFAQTCVLTGAEGFSFLAPAAMGDLLTVRARILQRQDACLIAECHVAADDRPVARGNLVLGLLRLDEGLERAKIEPMWRELHGAP